MFLPVQEAFLLSFFVPGEGNRFNFETFSEARISYYRRYKSGFLEKLEIGNGNDVVDCISVTVSLAVTNFVLYTEYILRTVYIALFSRYFIPERCVPKLTLLPVSCKQTCMYNYKDCNLVSIIIVILQY